MHLNLKLWQAGLCLLLTLGCAKPAQPVVAPQSAADVVSRVSELSARNPDLKVRFGTESGGWVAIEEGVVSSGWREEAEGNPKARLKARSRLPARADGAWEVFVGPGEDVGLRLVPEQAAPAALELEHGRAVYRQVRQSTDAVLVATEAAAELAYLLRDASAPSQFSWKLELGKGLARVEQEQGGLRFVDAKGQARLRMPQPFAVDAQGQRREAKLGWDARMGRITLTLELGQAAFPVLLDPVVETVLWLQQGTPGLTPPARDSHAMATLLNGHVLLFGGSNNGPYNDTWEWDGIAWTNKTPTPITTTNNPPARYNHAMATLANGHVVLFGGKNDSAVYFNDTWEWDGSSWTNKTPAALPASYPRARNGHAMAQGTGGNAVLFGGDSVSGFLNDTWEWDGSNWTNRTPSSGSPPARCLHAMAGQSDGKVVVFGGYAASSFLSLNDTWEWDGNAWTNVTPASSSASPPTRNNHAMAQDSSGHVVLFGGFNDASAFLNDTWTWDGSSWTNTTPNSGNLSARGAPAMARGPNGDVLLFGGFNGSSLNDTREWTGSAWVVPTTARLAQAQTTLGGQVVIFGGYRGGPLGDTLTWDGSTLISQTPNPSPSARAYSAMSTLGTTAVLFGGQGGPDSLGDTWTWNGSTWAMAAGGTSSPSPRFAHSMATLGTDAVLFGGANGSTYYQDTYLWNPTAGWREVSTAHAPSVRDTAAMAPYGGKLLLFGGYDGSVVFNDTWVFDGSDWTQLFPAHNPPGRSSPMLAPLGPQGPRLVLFGGSAGSGMLSDTWEWDGVDWISKGLSSPVARYAASMSSLNGMPVLFGGGDANNSPLGDLWTYSSSGYANGSPCQTGNDCATGYCVDDVCCDTACGGGVTNDCQACSIDAGAPADGTCQPSSGNACDDGNPCTANDVCSGGICAGIAVVCAAPDACHSAACNVVDGGCLQTALSGNACDDSDPCTTQDTCSSGTCAGTAVLCPASDACHTGSCNGADGGCLQTPVDGLPCPGGICAAGVCVLSTTASSTGASSTGSTASSNGTSSTGSIAGSSTASSSSSASTSSSAGTTASAMGTSGGMSSGTGGGTSAGATSGHASASTTSSSSATSTGGHTSSSTSTAGAASGSSGAAPGSTGGKGGARTKDCGCNAGSSAFDPAWLLLALPALRRRRA